MRRLPAVLLIALALPALAQARPTAQAPTVPAPSGLHAFLLRSDESQTTTFPRTPSFAWTPVSGAWRYEFQLATSLTFGDGTIVWESSDAAKPLRVPAASVDVFHLLFPDPWPKRRHHCRRCFTEIFLGRLLVALKSGGVLHLATDDADYFAQMQRVLATTSTLERIDELPELPVTTFEQRFRERGLPIHRVLLRKVSEVT